MLDILIQRDTIAAHAQIAKNVTNDTLQPFILHAQNLDCKPVFGNVAWTDLLKNSNSENYQTLLNGGEYTVGSNTYSFAGLAAAIACYSYARYITGKNVVDSTFGVVVKTTDVSEPADPKLIAANASQFRSLGEQYIRECLEFVRYNPEKYPKFVTFCAKENKIRQSTRISFSDRTN